MPGQKLLLAEAAGLITADGPLIVHMGVQNNTVYPLLGEEMPAKQPEKPPANALAPKIRLGNKLVQPPDGLPGGRQASKYSPKISPEA